MSHAAEPRVAASVEEVESVLGDLDRGLDPAQAGLVAALTKVMPTPDQDVREVRDGLERVAAAMPAPVEVRVEEVRVGDRPAELLTPDRVEEDRVALYLHGGAYVIGSPATSRALAARFATVARARTLVLDYRLAPDHVWPAPLDDALAALRHLAVEHGPTRVVLAGDSAGAGLALATALRADQVKVDVGAVVAMSPWSDLVTSAAGGDGDTLDPQASTWFLERSARMLALTPQTLADASPVLHPDLGSLPATLVQVGAAEGLLGDAVRLSRAALRAGAPLRLEVWPQQMHVFHAFAPRLAAANAALAAQGRWLDAVLGPDR